jgi:RNA-directed DNA polymerase
LRVAVPAGDEAAPGEGPRPHRPQPRRQDIREVIAELNLVLRGWGNYFRTGNAADKFIQADRSAAWRLRRLLVKKRGRNLRAGQADQWDRNWMHGMGLHKLAGTVRYPRAA